MSRISSAPSAPPRHLFRGGEAEAVGEDRQAGPGSRGRRAQVIAPADGRLQGLLAVARRRAAAAAEQPQVAGEPGEQLVKAYRAQPERGQLDRKRDAVKQTAEPHEPRQRVRGHLESGDRRRGPVREQAHRVAAVAAVRQRRDAEDHLAWQVKRLTAGHQQLRAAAAQDRIGEGGAGLEDVLAGVQDEQQVLAAQLTGEPAGPRQVLLALVLPRHAQRGRHRVGDARRVPRRGQVREKHPVGNACASSPATCTARRVFLRRPGPST